MSDNIRRKLFNSVLMVLPVMLFVLSISAQNMFRKITDFDGDGKSDYAVARNENGLKVWYVWQSTAGFRVFQWGLETDHIVPGDYDGDGKTDFAIFRIVQVGFVGFNAFYINESSTNSLSVKLVNQAQTPGDTPQQQDYDGDGITDPATKSGLSKPGFASSIVILSSLSNSLTGGAISANYIPVRTGDMDGDSRSDVTSFTTAINLTVQFRNIQNPTIRTQIFGLPGDQFVPADFDGDGIGDLTVWRRSEGNWYWLKSSDGTFQSVHWGVSGDIPVPGDYDGDGKTDQAIWRSGSPQSFYWVNGSQNGVSIFAWGLSTDTVVRY